MNLQGMFASLNPPNYGTISTIIIHLIRHLMVTPRVSHRFLARSLRDIRFEEVMMDFGMFFLHNLDLETMDLPDCQEDDDAEVLKVYGNAVNTHGRKTKTQQEVPYLALTKQAQQKNHPWGSSITWRNLEDLLSTIPHEFLKPVEFDHDTLHLPESKLLFTQFSVEIWLSVHSSYLKGGQYPPLDNFQSAMDLWTVDGLEEVVTDFHILPNGHGLPGCPPRRISSQKSFQDRASIYFPSPTIMDSKQKCLWQHYACNNAYLDVYHGYLKIWDREKTNLLNNDLELIFSHLQCLPFDAHDKTTPVIWQAHQQKLQFIANPKYYPIAKIGQPTKPMKGTQKAQLPVTVIQRKLFEDKCVVLSTIPIAPYQRIIYYKRRHGDGSFKRRRQDNRNKSSKVLNKRAPPPRKKASGNGLTVMNKEGQGSKRKPFIPLASRGCLGLRNNQENIYGNDSDAAETEDLSVKSPGSDYSNDKALSGQWKRDEGDVEADRIIYRFDEDSEDFD